MANFQTVYAFVSLTIALALTTSFIVQAAVPHDGSAEDLMRTNGKFFQSGLVVILFVTFIGSIVVLVLRKKGAV
jgi:hypothetical protein